ncbi:MAG: 30S ribosomal protein S12 methylthiotransferase RimO [Firmicutes bacterium]|nr:30S ribosomal protein S12 methylthiotransferase RimO [Bacillota bacterium]
MTVSAYLLSLGCAKNQVDGEAMAGALARAGYTLTEDPAQARVIIVNTCGFIEAAKEESIAAMLQAAQYKETGSCRLLVCAGCMAGKYARELAEAMPEVDVFVAPGDFADLLRQIGKRLAVPAVSALPAGENWYLHRRRAAPGHSAYIKIAEGCDNHCSYCLIPQLRGAYVSRPLEDILAEAALLAEQGVQEAVLVAQDTAGYGLDLYGRRSLYRLLESLAALPLPMIRVLYLYPTDIDEDLLRVMAAHENICDYFDIPVQHGDDRILAAMNRRGNRRQILDKIALIRRYLPQAVLRTTAMVGFPGETEESFANLLDFVEQARFDWLGAFAYSAEEDTPAAALPGQIAPAVKAQRLNRLMEAAAQITAAKRQAWVGRQVRVLTDGPAEAEYGPGWYKGRSWAEAPEVDGVIYFRGENLRPGDWAPVRITGAETFDLVGETL